MSSTTSFPLIEDYGLIGNLHTTALVSRWGDIDFLSFPRFDSPTIFTRLLDGTEGGFLSLRPSEEDYQSKQLYLPETNILLTRFLSKAGIVELTDLMPIADEEQQFAIYRRLRCISGKHRFSLVCDLRFDYGRQRADISQGEDGSWSIQDPRGEQPALRFAADVELKETDGKLRAAFTLEAGEEITVVLRCQGGEDKSEEWGTVFHRCRQFWREWMAQSNYTGPWREAVHRSALVLKLLTSVRYGSTVAAATFSLPETLGGTRNWDYRYTWIRDAAFTMYAFLRLGFTQEAGQFMEWIERYAGQDLQLLYAVDGSTEMPESELEHLSGYENSQPVRIGNAAAEQKQLDIFGELIDTIYLYHQSGGSVTYEFWQTISHWVEYVIDHWQDEDHGIWEVRNRKRRFLHSTVCCWVAIDRALKIAEARSLPYDEERWRGARDTIFEDVYTNFWNEERQAFTQARGGDELDASALLMPLLRFVSSKEPRWVKTLEAIERELITDVLVFRYRQEKNEVDGIEGSESSFTICSFWYVECLARYGRQDEAKLAFEKLLGYANHLGLFSEEISLRGRQLGNFPQAFSHLSLISAAFQIGKREKE